MDYPTGRQKQQLSSPLWKDGYEAGGTFLLLVVGASLSLTAQHGAVRSSGVHGDAQAGGVHGRLQGQADAGRITPASSEV